VTTGLIVLVAALVLAAAIGVSRRVRDGRLRVAPEADRASPAAELVEGGLGERATLVQFSTAFCAPCRATRQLLTLVAGQSPGVRHVEIDAESHLELVRSVGIARTPTTLVLDAAGHETSRITGLPRRDAVEAATRAGESSAS